MTRQDGVAEDFDPAQLMRRDAIALARRQGDDRAERLAAAQQRLLERQAIALDLSYPESLPISAHAEEIRTLLEAHPVVVVAGETGSGKTTQLPKICLEAGFGRRGLIAHTQPRRLAARTVASRIAEEVGVPLGDAVGYAVRFSDQTSDRTLVKLVTDGLLLTEIRRDKDLDGYDVVIVDEAHERSLNVDFLLGYLKALLARRDDLKVVITSATIDVAAFAGHFDDAPVVEVGGRGYPVTTHYLEGDAPYEDKLVDAIERIDGDPAVRTAGAARDVLVFQSGEREILDTARLLRRQFGERFEVLPLYARLSPRDQQRVFQSGGGRRRIVLATNVAETSITVPNIGYVVDPGLARISRYSFRSKLQRLPVEPVSQASANQRQGRCGRVAPGHCFRLYDQADFEGRPRYTDPEIVRSNLAAVVLSMRAFGLGDPLRFPFLDPPEPGAVRDAHKLLEELGALRGDRLTRLGRSMARLPVDPRLARMLLAADRERSLTEVLVIVSALTVQDPRERPLDKQGAADACHERYLDERSDFLSLWNLWQWVEARRDQLSRSALKKALAQNFLNAARLREWRELHRQLRLACRDLGLRENDEPADYGSVHRALLTGSLSLLGQHDEKGHYLGPRQLKFRIFPGSALVEKRPRWLIAAEITETRRVYARTVAGVEPGWIEAAAGHLLKRRYSEPHWNPKRGEAEAFEAVTLYGLRLVEKRRVSVTRRDPVVARELLLLDGLVRGGLDVAFDFLGHNQALIADILDDEAKGRRRDLLIPEEELAALYDRVLPAEVLSVATLSRWWAKADPPARELLYFNRDQLLQAADGRSSETDFPSSLTLRGVSLPLKYRFAPGEPDDGVNLVLDVGALESLVPEALDWHVPGYFDAVCEQWLRTLPKQKRRQLAPLPDRLPEITARLRRPDRYRQGRLSTALGEVLKDLYQLQVDASDWDLAGLEAHLRINVQVRDGDGRLLAQSRDAAALKAEFAAEAAARVSAQRGGDREQRGLVDFPDVPLEDRVELRQGGGRVLAYPALVDRGRHVDLTLLPTAAVRDRADRDGYARLALLRLGQTTRYLKKRLEARPQLGLHYATLGDAAALSDELLRAAAWNCCFEGRPLPRSDEAFAARLDECRGHLADTFERLLDTFAAVLQARFELVRELDAATSPAFADAVADIRAWLERLVPAQVLSQRSLERLGELPGYLAAARYRLANLQGKVERDGEHSRVLAALQERLDRLTGEPAADRERLDALQDQLERLRVALFAQPLAGREKVSAKRCDRALLAYERELGVA